MINAIFSFSSFKWLNINSINAENRFDQLSDICRTLKLAVMVPTESKLDEDGPSFLLLSVHLLAIMNVNF